MDSDFLKTITDSEIKKEFEFFCSQNLSEASNCFLQLIRKLEDLNKENEFISSELSKKDNRTRQLEKKISSITKLNEIYEKEEEELSQNFQRLKNETYRQKLEIDELKKKLSAKESKCEMLKKSNSRLVSMNDKQNELKSSKITNKKDLSDDSIKFQQKEDTIVKQKEQIKVLKAEYKEVNRKRIDLNNEVVVLNHLSKVNAVQKLDCNYHAKKSNFLNEDFINFRKNFKF